MANRNTILKQIKTDFEKITVANGYNSNVKEVKSGIYSYGDIVQRPCIFYWAYKDAIEKHLMNNRISRILHIIVYGYADVDYNNDDKIYNLADDVETLLYSTDFTNTNKTWLGDITVFVGSKKIPAAMFSIEITVQYIRDLN